MTVTREDALRRIVVDRLGGAVVSVGSLAGSYSGGTLFRVRARLADGERDVVVKLGRVKGSGRNNVAA